MDALGLNPNPQDSPNPLLAQIRRQTMQQAPPPAPAPLPPPSPDTSMFHTPAPSVQAPRGTLTGEQNERTRLLNEGAPSGHIAEKIEGAMPNHPTLGKTLGLAAQIPAQIGDTLLSAIAPGLASRIPGTEGHHQALVNREDTLVGNLSKQGLEQAQGEEAQARVPLEGAQTREADARAYSLTHPNEKDSMEWAVEPNFVGPNGEPVLYSRETGEFKVGDQTLGIKRVEKEATPKGMESKAGTLNGKPAFANYHPDKGIYTDDEGNVLHGFIPAPNYAQVLPMVLGSKTTDIINPDTGVPQTTQFNTKTGTYDKPVGTPGASAYGHQIESATAATRMINNSIFPLVDKMEKMNELGPVQGRFEDFLNRKVGNAPPDVAQFHQLMNGVVSMMMGMYGFRRQQAVDALSQEMGARMTPESIRSSLKGILQHAESIQGGAVNPSAGGTPPSGGGGGATPPPNAKIVKFEDIK